MSVNRGSGRRLLYLFFFLVSLCTCQTPRAASPTPTPRPVSTPDWALLGANEAGEIAFAGLVIENNLGCEVDASCRLLVEVGDQLITVVYHYGEWPPCENQAAVTRGLDMVPGSRVEIYGVIVEGSVSTCDSPDYYIVEAGANE